MNNHDHTVSTTNCNNRMCECFSKEGQQHGATQCGQAASPRRCQAESEHPKVFMCLRRDLIL